MTTALITGAGGFCATHLARRLREEGCFRVVGISRNPVRPEHEREWDELLRVERIAKDAMGEVLQTQRPGWIFHLAGRFAATAEQLQEANVGTTVALLAAVRAHAPDAAVLLVGSAAEYGSVPLSELPVLESRRAEPESAYGRSKLEATQVGLALAREWGGNLRVARPFNIVGAGVPASLVTGALIERARRVVSGQESVVKVGNIDTQRDFIAVEDVVDAYVRMMRPDCAGEIFNLCSGRPCAIRKLIELLRAVAAHPIPIEVDQALIRLGDNPVSYGSGEKARAFFGFAPQRTLEESLAAAWRKTGASGAAGKHP